MLEDLGAVHGSLLTELTQKRLPSEPLTAENVLQVLEDPSSPFPESKLTLRRITKVMQQAEAWNLLLRQ